MAGNPLVPQASTPAPPAADAATHVVHLVSNVPPNKVEGAGEFIAIFNKGKARAEVTQFRHVIQRKARRAMGGKFGRGLTNEVTETIELNPNQDLFGLRRWLGTVRHDPSAVLLLQPGKMRDEPLAAPLAFSELMRTGRPILVSGLDTTSRDQLLTQVDLKFAQVPTQVARNYSLKTMLLARTQRPKGFSSSMRGLLELDFLPKSVADKVTQISTGGDVSGLTEPEVINLSLLSDLVSRYDAVVAQFKEVVKESTLQVPQLIAMFELLTADMNLEVAQETFKGMLKDLAEQNTAVESKAQLFGHIYRFLSGTGDEARKTQDRHGQFFRILTNAFIRRRSQIDPLLWKRCHFLNSPNAADEGVLKGIRPYLASLDQWLANGGEGVVQQAAEPTAKQIYHLASIAGKDPGVMREDVDFARHRLANQLLPLFRTKAFDTDLLAYGSGMSENLPPADSFAADYKQLPFTLADLEQIRASLVPVLRANENTADALQKSVVDVMLRHARQRDQTLREIYILNAVRTLVKYPFHVGPNALNSIERHCCVDLMQSRMGLEFHPSPVSDFSIGLFAAESDPPLGKLQNDPLTLCRAYSRLIGLRIEDVVKRTVDHKINYFIKTFGENFFEVIYERVVRKNDIPLSQGQLAHVLKQHNILGSLDEKGLRPEAVNEYEDPFLAAGMRRFENKQGIELPAILGDFQTEYNQSLTEFRALLNDLKSSAENDPREENPKRIIWGFYKLGIYNLSREETRGAFRKTNLYKSLQEMIAKISSERYSVFHKDSTSEGVKIFIPRGHTQIIIIGDRFGFLDANQVVKYQLLPSPVGSLDKLDETSRVFMECLQAEFDKPDKEKWVRDLQATMAEIQRCNAIWTRFSRNLSFAILDRVISETVIKELQPDRLEPKHLYYLPDAVKLCLGKATVGEESVPFTKMLQRPDIIGNISKNTNSSSSTIDDFTIEIHKIAHVWAELKTYASIAEDVLDIIQSLSHDRAEMSAAVHYEKEIRQILQLLAKPLRDLSEKDVQTFHEHAKNIKEVLQALYNSPSSSKRKITTRLQAQLEARRSDRQVAKLNFTDVFVLAKQEVTVRQMVQKGDERVSVQRKREIEVDPAHQTLPLRIREVIRLQEFINNKQHIVFSAEGQKKKQVDYVLEAIDTLITMRGNSLHIFIDTSMLEESQVHALATRVKPTNFFDMNDVKPEAPVGMKIDVAVDPLSGRAVRNAEPGAAQSAAPATDPNAPVVLRCSKDPAVSYRHDPAASAYFLQAPEGEIKSSVFPVDLGKNVLTVILMTRLAAGRPVFHGLFGNEVLLPEEQRPAPPKLCTFRFFDQTVSIVNEGGKPTVKIEKESSDFLDAIRSIN